MPVSIEDVAKRANVSISTVSRVVNGKAVVSPKTRARVEEAINSLGYRPNVFARGLMLRRSDILGMVLPDVHGDFYSEVIRGANQEAQKLGRHLLVTAVPSNDDGHAVLSALGSQGLVDGVAVMLTEINSRVSSSLGDLGVPFVMLDGNLRGVRHDSVAIDQQAGAECMANHLLATNPADRLIFIGGPETNLDTRARLAALKEGLRNSGRVANPEDVYFLDYRYETAFAFCMERILDWAAQPTSVFAANDEMAAGVIDAAIASTLDVPGNIRVAGFDDTRVAQLIRPRLTTVRVPMAEMGATAIRLLDQRLSDSDRSAAKVLLEPELVIRESCGVLLKK